MRHALVTGSSGYVGRVLVDQLLTRGYRVTGIDVILQDRTDKEFVQFWGDVRDVGLLDKAMIGVDVVFHNAASVPLEMTGSLGASNNEDMCATILAASYSKGVQKVVFVSSSAVYGKPKTNPLTEESIIQPFDSYGKSKALCEEECSYWVSRGLDITIIRPRTVLGGNRLGLMGVLFDLVRSNAPVPVVTGNRGCYQLIHVDDLVDGIILSGEQFGSSSYNLGANDPEPMKNVLEKFIESVSSKSHIVSINRTVFTRTFKILQKLRIVPFTQYQIQMYGEDLWFDTSKAKRELGWNPKWTGLEMLQDSYNRYVENTVSDLNQLSVHSRPIKSKVLKLAIQMSRLRHLRR